MNNTPDAITTAVQWWSDVLTGKRDKGDPGIEQWFDDAIHDAIRDSRLAPLTDEQVQTFEETLLAHITAEIQREGECIVQTDYAPKGLLEEAADDARIDAQGLRFPIKTVMIVRAEKCIVRAGYSANPVQIY